MYEFKKNGNVFTSKLVGTGPSSYEKRIYRAAISQSLRSTGLDVRRPNFAWPRPHPLLWAGSRASSGKTAVK